MLLSIFFTAVGGALELLGFGLLAVDVERARRQVFPRMLPLPIRLRNRMLQLVGRYEPRITGESGVRPGFMPIAPAADPPSAAPLPADAADRWAWITSRVDRLEQHWVDEGRRLRRELEYLQEVALIRIEELESAAAATLGERYAEVGEGASRELRGIAFFSVGLVCSVAGGILGTVA